MDSNLCRYNWTNENNFFLFLIRWDFLIRHSSQWERENALANGQNKTRLSLHQYDFIAREWVRLAGHSVHLHCWTSHLNQIIMLCVAVDPPVDSFIIILTLIWSSLYSSSILKCYYSRIHRVLSFILKLWTKKNMFSHSLSFLEEH